MPRKIAIIALALVLLIGGYFAVRAIVEQQARAAYLASPNKVADDFIHDLTAQNAQDAYANLFIDTFKNDYSLDYWSKQYFPQFVGMTGTPQLVSAGKFSQDRTQPSAYPIGADVRQFVYRFTIHDTEYDLMLIIMRNGQDHWKIRSITGDYKAAP